MSGIFNYDNILSFTFCRIFLNHNILYFNVIHWTATTFYQNYRKGSTTSSRYDLCEYVWTVVVASDNSSKGYRKKSLGEMVMDLESNLLLSFRLSVSPLQTRDSCPAWIKDRERDPGTEQRIAHESQIQTKNCPRLHARHDFTDFRVKAKDLISLST